MKRKRFTFKTKWIRTGWNLNKNATSAGIESPEPVTLTRHFALPVNECARDRGRMTRRTLLVFSSFLLLYLFTAGGHLYSPDEEIMYRVTESIAMRGALDIEPI